MSSKARQIADYVIGLFTDRATGNVGIGTNDPKARLHAVASLVSGATYRPSAPFVMERDGDCELQIIANEANISQVRFGNGLTNFAGAVSYNHLTNELLIFTIGVSRHRIASDGAQSSVSPGGSTLLPEFKCRAWVNFDGTGTPSIRAGGNVSSIARRATGRYTFNFSTAMPDTNYSVTLGGMFHTGVLSGFAGHVNDVNFTASSFEFDSRNVSEGSYDNPQMFVHVIR